MFLRPLSDCIEVATCVDSVEVDEGFRATPWRLIPYLAEYANVNRTHELLPQYIKAVC